MFTPWALYIAISSPKTFYVADLSRIKLIDFGISTKFGLGRPGSKYNPLKDRKNIVGTLYWASLNSHNGEGMRYILLSICFSNIYIVDLTPRDDIESLAYVAFFLLHGTLPWMPRPCKESAVLARNGTTYENRLQTVSIR